MLWKYSKPSMIAPITVGIAFLPAAIIVFMMYYDTTKYQEITGTVLDSYKYETTETDSDGDDTPVKYYRYKIHY